MKHCEFLVINSGTASLEAAFVGTPHIIVAKASRLTYEIALRVVKIKWLGLPNIIMNKTILPELIQKDATAEKIVEQIHDLLGNEEKYNNTKVELGKIKKMLGKYKTSERTAKIIREMVNE